MHSSLAAAWRGIRLSVEIHAAPCILDRGLLRGLGEASPRTHFFVNPANEGLVGIQYPTFPRGGQNGALPFRSPTARLNWCRAPGVRGDTQDVSLRAAETAGLEPPKKRMLDAARLLYGDECVEGRVHLACGEELGRWLDLNCETVARIHGVAVRCVPGDCVWSPSFGELRADFPAGIVHAVAPFWGRQGYLDELFRDDGSPGAEVSEAAVLKNAYLRALALAEGVAGPEAPLTIVSPFLGTGVRGWGLPAGVRLAAAACVAHDAGPPSAVSSRLVFVTNRAPAAVVEAVVSFSEALAVGPTRFAREF